jgi:cytochrome c
MQSDLMTNNSGNQPHVASWSAAFAVALALFNIGGEPASAQTVVRDESLFRARCSSCHALDRNRWGPALGGVLGRRAGAAAGFRYYSAALRASGVVWDDITLDRWLDSPTRMVPGTRMTVRVRSREERVAIIRYLRASATRPRADP